MAKKQQQKLKKKAKKAEKRKQKSRPELFTFIWFDLQIQDVYERLIVVKLILMVFYLQIKYQKMTTFTKHLNFESGLQKRLVNKIFIYYVILLYY